MKDCDIELAINLLENAGLIAKYENQSNLVRGGVPIQDANINGIEIIKGLYQLRFEGEKYIASVPGDAQAEIEKEFEEIELAIKFIVGRCLNCLEK